jgi:FemAB-related protein (PEP-CTERM system-associated)
MALMLRSLEPRHAEAWDAFVVGHPSGTFFHRAAWAKVIATAFGHASLYTLAERDGVIVGVLPLAQMKTRLFGNTLVSTPFCVYGGPLAADAETAAALATHAEALRARSGATAVELRQRDPADNYLQTGDFPAGAGSAGNWVTRADLYVTFRKPIVANDDANLKAIPRKQRAMVRKGIQHGLASRVDQDADTLHRIYAESVRNLGTPVFARRYFRILLAVFRDCADVVTVLDNGTPVAAVLNFYFRDEVLPYYGGGTQAARRVAGNDFMYWEVLRRAAARGARLFDFGRSKVGTGAFAFKHNWGFTPAPLPYRYSLAPGAAIPDHNPLNPKYRLFIAAWKRLPLPIANLIGPPIVRGLG